MFGKIPLSNSVHDGGFSIVCGVKDRVEPLRYTIPTFLQLEMARQIVLVDWSSSVPLIDSLAELDIPGWPDPRVIITRVVDQPHWNLAKALNVGMRLVNQPVTLKVDADILILSNIDDNLPKVGKSFVAGNWRIESGNQIHLNGTTIFGTEDFRNVGGYDERIDSYGWEDDDLYRRLQANGLERCQLNHRRFFHLPHSNTTRMAHQKPCSPDPVNPIRNSWLNQKISKRRAPWNRDYRQSKYQILTINETQRHVVVQEQTDQAVPNRKFELVKFPTSPREEVNSKHRKNAPFENSPAAFLISLEREFENRSAVFDELKKLNLGTVQVLSAFDGAAKLPFTSKRLEPFLGTLGCLISHLTIYLYCHHAGIERAIIFEDDVQVVNSNLANGEIKRGESSASNICCYCAQSRDNQFLNCHAYSMSLISMQACLASLDSIIQKPLNIHIDRMIEYCRRRHGFSYSSLRNSSIIQDKSRPFTIKWGQPDFVSKQELQVIKQALVSNPAQLKSFSDFGYSA